MITLPLHCEHGSSHIPVYRAQVRSGKWKVESEKLWYKLGK